MEAYYAMHAGQRFALALGAASIVLAAAASAGTARDGVRSIPVAAIDTGPERNISDVKPDANRPRSVERGQFAVTVDRAKVIRFPDRTQTVVVGNPAIADVSMQKNGVVVLTGKSFGVTNFLALDSTGTVLADAMVSVNAPNDGTIVVQRGLDRQTYSCTPNCQPSVVLGDSNGYFSDVKGQVDLHSQFSGQK